MTLGDGNEIELTWSMEGLHRLLYLLGGASVTPCFVTPVTKSSNEVLLFGNNGNVGVVEIALPTLLPPTDLSRCLVKFEDFIALLSVLKLPMKVSTEAPVENAVFDNENREMWLSDFEDFSKDISLFFKTGTKLLATKLVLRMEPGGIVLTFISFPVPVVDLLE